MQLTQQDLIFFLKQIKIAEANSTAHSGGNAKALTDIWVDNQGNTSDTDGILYTAASEGAQAALGNALLPFGLRTVDGSYNNFMDGREHYGASGEPFYRWSDAHWASGTGDMPGYASNNEYEAPGDVVDTAPRTISNLIVDQTPNNPAAIMAALQDAGYDGDFHAAVTAIQQEYATYTGYVDMGFDDNVLDIFKGLFDTKLQNDYGIEMDGSTIMLPNRAPDDGISASYNAFFAAFGQFFDHGLDLVAKGGNGTVYIPLQQDDPLYDPESHTNFMVVTRATVGDEARNITTPWVDQNQTYTSDPSHQVFLREYTMVDGQPMATGKLLEGSRGMATWADVKQQAREKLGIELTDKDATQVPVLLVDAYGEFVRGENGLPQLLAAIDPNGAPIYVEGNLENPVDPSAIVLPPGTLVMGSNGEAVPADATVSAAITGHAFLDDIAHEAVPRKDAAGNLLQDADTEVGYVGDFDGRGQTIHYDNELLDAHYITGDGRGNENISLTVVHHIFHGEHNLVADHVKDVALTSGDINLLNEWLLTDLTETEYDALLEQMQLPGADLTALSNTLNWDGERIFQAARFTTEMEYQHLVFEEFARKIQPDIDAFTVFPDAELDPVIYSEFADVVYRFGHSMLNESFHQISADGVHSEMALFDAFLNPLGFGSEEISHDEAAGALIRGMTGQVGNEIDEFVTNVLRNELLGIPLDLAATNIARARDTGTPTLNQARAQFMEMAGGDTQLKPYESWADFSVNLKNPASIINFVAAYGTHQTILDATTIDEKRDAAFDLIMGGGSVSDSDRLDFLNARGDYANDPDLGGLQNVDMWVGGLAEQKMSFGGMLGSTFSFIFEMQLETLQDADRFYYLSRAQGQNLLTQLEANSLAKMAMRNTDLGETGFALPSDIFAAPGLSLYVDHDKQMAMTLQDDPTHTDPTLGGFIKLVDRGDGSGNYLRYNGDEHVSIMGTDDDDHIIAGKGDDTIWGGKGNDRIEAGYGVDQVHGGEGDDIITNSGTDIGEVDMLHGDDGNDVIHGGSGMALIFGGAGKDFLMTGPDGSEIRAGTGDDFLLGGEGSDILFGNEGDDWIEAGGKFDYIAGDNGELFFNSTIIGHDVMNGGGGETDYDADSGDDIMFATEGIQKFIGMWGHDWVIHKGQTVGADADMNIEIFPTLPIEVLRDRYSQVEAVSGAELDDVLRGDDRTTDGEAEEELFDPTPEGNFKYNELDEAGIERISGLNDIVTDDLLQQREYWADSSGEIKNVFVGGNILLGGGGSDTIEGRGGNDLIDGDAWLNVRVSIRENQNGTGAEIASVDSLKDNVTLRIGNQDITKPLTSWMVEGAINPGQLQIVREILYDDSGTDTAVYWDAYENYDISYKGEGRLIIDHTGFDDGEINPQTGRKYVSDDTDIVRNIEVLSFGDTDVNVIVGTSGNDVGASGRLDGDNGRDILIGLEGNDLLRGLGGDDMLFGDAGNDDLRGGGGNDILDGGAGNDLVQGQNGDDTLIWNIGGGHDILDGGNGTDTVEIYGSDTDSDTFAVYDRANAISQGYTLRDANSEIVIVHNDSVIAELIDIEEIVIDGQGGGDNFMIAGDFSGTSLAMSTITLVGSEGDDTVDISALQSDHRVVFQSSGGNDTVIGALRPQDVIQREDGESMAGYNLTENGNGTSTLATDGHSVTFATSDEQPGFGDGSQGNNGNGQGNGNGHGHGHGNGNGNGNGHGHGHGNGKGNGNNNGSGNGNNPKPPTNSLPTVPSQVSLPTIKSNETLTILSSMLLAGTADANNDVLKIQGLSASSGTLERVSSNQWTFTPDPDALGAVLFDFRVSDGKGSVAHKAATTVEAAVVEETPPPAASPDSFIGTEAADTIMGGDGDDVIFGHGGNDTIVAGTGNDQIFGGDGNDIILGGDGDDVIFGGAGDDVIMGGNGDDIIYAGSGNDTVFGGDGDDTLMAEAGDGNDIYFGDGGSDTLDMSALTANSTVTLSHTGPGIAESSQSGTDTLFSIENVRTGSGDDVIYASEAINVMDGGAGADTFVFTSTLAADKDTIVSFESVDTIDLSRIDADTTSNGNQAFGLVTGSAFTHMAGELLMRTATDDEGRDITLVEGDVNGDGAADFQITLMGSHELIESQFIF